MSTTLHDPRLQDPTLQDPKVTHDPHDLHALRAGFTHEAYGSQAVFRAALDALSRPGRLVSIGDVSELPRAGYGAAAALLLALLDADCTLWLSASLRRGDAGAWLRFHTGCQLVEDIGAAQFAWVARGDMLPALDSLRCGSDEFPDHSATCIIEVGSVNDGGASSVTDSSHADSSGWTLTGPGIAHAQHISVPDLDCGFVPQWQHNHSLFPRGVDVYLATRQHVLGLPRTTRITIGTEA